jgi:hypothetical protein
MGIPALAKKKLHENVWTVDPHWQRQAAPHS